MVFSNLFFVMTEKLFYCRKDCPNKGVQRCPMVCKWCGQAHVIQRTGSEKCNSHASGEHTFHEQTKFDKYLWEIQNELRASFRELPDERKHQEDGSIIINQLVKVEKDGTPLILGLAKMNLAYINVMQELGRLCKEFQTKYGFD